MRSRSACAHLLEERLLGLPVGRVHRQHFLELVEDQHVAVPCLVPAARPLRSRYVAQGQPRQLGQRRPLRLRQSPLQPQQQAQQIAVRARRRSSGGRPGRMIGSTRKPSSSSSGISAACTSEVLPAPEGE